MNRLFACIVLSALAVFASVPALAQQVSVPAELQVLPSLKMQATRSLNEMLSGAQRTQISGIARATQSDLERSFAQVSAADGPVTKTFTPAQLLAVAAALRMGQMPNLSADQMASLSQFMSDIVMKAGPTWQSGAGQVNALLRPDQKTRINALRARTLSQLPAFAFLGMPMFAGVGDGSQLGGFATDPGSFALLLSIPDVDRFVQQAKRQSAQP